jgi:hypothetical protein
MAGGTGFGQMNTLDGQTVPSYITGKVGVWADEHIRGTGSTPIHPFHVGTIHAVRGAVAGRLLVPPAGGLPQQCHCRGSPHTLL